MFTPEDVFDTCVGLFWGIQETRDYMRARFALVEALNKVNTHASVQAQLDHLMDIMRLCRGDNMGVRDLVPALMLQLNKDQECYDFLKWWATTGEKYDWGNLELPYLDIKNADAFESDKYLRKDFVNLSHTVAFTLLKIKLLLDLTALRDAALGGKKAPDSTQVHSPIVAGNHEIMECDDLLPAINELTTQVGVLYEAIKKGNKFFWPTLLEPGSHLTTRPSMYTFGSLEHTQLVLQYSYDSWVEAPGAIEMIRKHATAVGDS